eukprot:m.211629 g.211629  ORF g.211629 m.211629 type:complete len:167 (+) comp18663_c0_seq1:160-660(+)
MAKVGMVDMEAAESSVDDKKEANLAIARKLASAMVLQALQSSVVAIVTGHPDVNGKMFALGSAIAGVCMVAINLIIFGVMRHIAGAWDFALVLRVVVTLINMLLLCVGIWRETESDHLATVLLYAACVLINAFWIFFDQTPTFAETNAFNKWLLRRGLAFLCCRKQ